MKKALLAKQLWKNFLTLLKDLQPLEDYCSYYQLIVAWVKSNRKTLGEDVIQNSRLGILIELDPSQYVIDNPDFLLKDEYTRLKAISPTKRDTIVMLLGDTLWDMVTMYSGLDCPQCRYDELRFLIAKEHLTDHEHLILSCNSCGWAQDIDGDKWENRSAEILPANKDDLLKYGI